MEVYLIMDDYEKVSEVKEEKEITQYTPEISLIQYKKLSGWASFMGIFTIVNGILLCLGIVTAIFGVPLIIAGLKLVGAVDSMKVFSETKDINKLSDTFDKLNLYFKFYGILMLVGLILGFLSFIGLIVLGFFASSQQYGY